MDGAADQYRSEGTGRGLKRRPLPWHPIRAWPVLRLPQLVHKENQLATEKRKETSAADAYRFRLRRLQSFAECRCGSTAPSHCSLEKSAGEASEAGFFQLLQYDFNRLLELRIAAFSNQRRVLVWSKYSKRLKL